MITCRNLLIYLKPEVQQQAIATFHFALNSEGYLFLGSSESLNDLSHGFHVIDSRWRIFQKNNSVRLPFEVHRLKPEPIAIEEAENGISVSDNNSRNRLTEVYNNLLTEFVSSGIIFDTHNEIIHINGDVIKYFPTISGRLTSNILDWASGNLKIALSSALSRAKKTNSQIEITSIEVEGIAFKGVIKLTISPFKAMGDWFYFLQILPEEEPSKKHGQSASFDLQQDAQDRIESLELEVRELQSSLYSALEEKKSSQEELQASNEELRASNEELQSSNEELQTITSEHENKIRELISLNNDISNFLYISEIAVVFLDNELKIRKFTPIAESLLDLSAKDVERPFRNLNSKLFDINDIISDSLQVLKLGSTIEKEIITEESRSFLCRILPYRDENNLVRGVVISLTEITRLKAAEFAVQESEIRYRAAVEAVNDAIWSLDLKTGIFECSDQWFKMLGYEIFESALAFDDFLKMIHDDDKKSVKKLFYSWLEESDSFDEEFRIKEFDGNYKWISCRGNCIKRGKLGQPLKVLGTNSDISIRKALEVQQRQQQQLLSLLCDGVGLGFWSYDLKTEILEIDDVFQIISGVKGVLVNTSEFFGHCHPDDVGLFQALTSDVKEGHLSVLSCELRIFTPNDWKWVRFNGIVSEFDGNGDSAKMIGFLEDIDQRKRAEQEIRESEERYRQAVQIGNLGSWSFDFTNMTFKGDSGVYRIFEEEANEEEIGFDRLIDKVVFEDRERVGKLFNDYTQKKNFRIKHPQEILESFRINTGSGVRFLNISAHFNYDLNDSVTGIIGTVQDITDLKQAELDLKSYAKEIELQSRLLYSMIDNIPLAVMAKDAHNEFRYYLCNPSAEKLLGIGKELVIGKNDYGIYNKNDAKKFMRQDLQVVDDESVLDLGEVSLKINGKLNDVRIMKVPVYGPDRKVNSIFVIMEDVTEERSLEHQLNHSQKMDAVGRLAGGIAHDFNNMLQAIMGYGNIVREDLTEAKIQSDGIDMVLKAAEQARSLVKQLMAFSRKDELITKEISLVAMVKDLCKMLKRLIGEHIEIDTVINSNDAAVFADKGQLEQAIINLCINARDAMSAGGILSIIVDMVEFSKEDCIIHADAVPGKYSVLTIKDTGRGIPEEFREHIFEPFFTTKDLGKGTGLGLATVYAIIHRHDGFIKVESEEGIGSEFSIYLPAVKFTGEFETSSFANEQIPGGVETVLLAEDEEMVRKFTSRVLTRAGYKVISSSDGEEAVEMFKKHQDEIDILVFDVIMPKMNGRLAYNEIELIKPGIPVLFCSGYGDDLLRNEYMVEIDGRILPKPYQPKELLKELRIMLDRK